MTFGVDPSGYVAVANAVSTSSRGALRRSAMYALNVSSSHCSGLLAGGSLSSVANRSA